MTTQIHDDEIIDISITLEAAPQSAAGFGRVLFIGTDLTFTGGEDFKLYGSPSAVDNDTDLTSAQKKALKTALSQSPAPSDVMAAGADVTGSGETYPEALDRVIAAGGDFYGVCIEPRTDAEIIAMSDHVQTLPAGGAYKIFMAQSDDATLLSSAGPLDSTFSSMSSDERTGFVFHDDDTEFLDVGYLQSRLVFDPDDQSAGWQGVVRGVDPYSGAKPSGTEEDNAKSNNVNLMLPFGNATTYVSNGVTIQGRAISELVSADWFRARLRERLTALKLRKDGQGQKIPLSPEGQGILEGEIRAQFNLGITAGHFLGGSDAPTISFPDPIPDADIQAGVLKASASAQFESSAIKFDLNFNFTRV